MNKELEQFARQHLKNGLAKLDSAHRLVFKRMYSQGNLDATIKEVVDNMTIEKLDWAIKQVKISLDKKFDKETSKHLIQTI